MTKIEIEKGFFKRDILDHYTYETTEKHQSSKVAGVDHWHYDRVRNLWSLYFLLEYRSKIQSDAYDCYREMMSLEDAVSFVSGKYLAEVEEEEFSYYHSEYHYNYDEYHFEKLIKEEVKKIFASIDSQTLEINYENIGRN
jgi:hypothetical protein